MIRRALVFVLLVAAVAVPLARAGDPVDSGTIPGETTPPPSTDPGPDPDPVLLPDGITVDGIPVGGMTAEQAKAMIEATFGQPLAFVWGGTRWYADPASLGAHANVDGALQRAAAAAPGSEVDLVVVVRGDRKSVV